MLAIKSSQGRMEMPSMMLDHLPAALDLYGDVVISKDEVDFELR